MPGIVGLGIACEIALTSLIKEVDLSSVAACSSDKPVLSYILSAMGRSDTETQSTLRFGLGSFSSRSEFDYVTGRVIRLFEHLRVDGRN